MPVLRIPVGRYPLFLGDLAVTVEIHTTVAVFDDATVPFLLEALSIAPGGGWVARPMVVERLRTQGALKSVLSSVPCPSDGVLVALPSTSALSSLWYR